MDQIKKTTANLLLRKREVKVFLLFMPQETLSVCQLPVQNYLNLGIVTPEALQSKNGPPRKGRPFCDLFIEVSHVELRFAEMRNSYYPAMFGIFVTWPLWLFKVYSSASLFLM